MPEWSMAALTRRRAVGRRAGKVAQELEVMGSITLGMQLEGDLQHLTDKEKEHLEKIAKTSLTMAGALRKLHERLDK